MQRRLATLSRLVLICTTLCTVNLTRSALAIEQELNLQVRDVSGNTVDGASIAVKSADSKYAIESAELGKGIYQLTWSGQPGKAVAHVTIGKQTYLVSIVVPAGESSVVLALQYDGRSVTLVQQNNNAAADARRLTPSTKASHTRSRAPAGDGRTGGLAAPRGAADGANNCADAGVITNGVTPFSNVGATTDGPATTGASCTSFGSTTIANDVWFKYTATCTGTLTLSTCEQVGGSATFDTRIAIYNSCTCPVTSAQQIGCNDDDPTNACGLNPNFHSTATAAVTSGTCYLIRVGAFNAATPSGTGNLFVSCVGGGGGGGNCPAGGNGTDCTTPIVVGEGTFTGTTLDNPNSATPPSCGFAVNDEWYCYTATCTGTATASTCNPGTDAAFDTIVTVYASCGGAELACNDDDVACGTLTHSTATWSATSGTSYIVRVSGFSGPTGFQGAYELTIACGGGGGGGNHPECGTATHDCCTTGDVGCNDQACCNAVCDIDPFCCSTAWDVNCVGPNNYVAGGSAIEVGCGGCGGGGGVCGAGSNHDCCTTGDPGCSDASCCTAVCAIDPFCCSTAWDINCVGPNNYVPGGSAIEVGCGGCSGGGGVCGAGSDHDCFTTGNPGCTDETCCQTVCAIDPFCCSTAWDINCVGPNNYVAGGSALEQGCAPPAPGACCFGNGSCQDGLSADDCTTAGGTFQGSASLCSGVTCPILPCQEPNANCQNFATTAAYNSTNGVFHAADDFTPVTSGTVTGICWWGAYGTTGGVPYPDAFTVTYYSDGGGFPGATIASFTGGALTVTGPVNTGQLVIGVAPIFEYHASHAAVNVQAGQCFWVEVRNQPGPGGVSWFWENSAEGDAGFAQDSTGGAPPPNGYTVSDLTIGDNLAFCLSRAISASPNCLPAGPDNDACADAIPVGTLPASVTGQTTLAGIDTAPTCNTFVVDGPGVWYTVQGTGTTITASTCNPGTDYDTKLHIYCGTCTGLTCVTANDDGVDPTGCVLPDGNPFKSRVTWCSQSGVTYFILVSGFQGASGTYELTVSADATPCTATVQCIAVPTGACCVGANCSVISAASCSAAGGAYIGNGTNCGTSGGNPLTYNSGNVNLAIPDNNTTGVSHSFNVPDSRIMGDVNIGLVVTHTFVGDLTVTVTHGATSVVIIDRPGVPALGTFGCSSNNYNVMLDDQGTGGTIEALCGAGDANPVPTSPPSYTPNNPLSAFNGQDSAGSWTIKITDGAAQDTGSLVSWSIVTDTPGVSPCGVVGACCQNGNCTVTTQNSCTAGGGSFLGANTNCGGAAGTPVTYSASPNTPIPDVNAAGINSVINVPDSYSIADLNVRISITHTFVGDLCIELSHNGGPAVRLVARPGADVSGQPCHTGSPFGCGQPNYNAIVLDDQGAGGALETQCTANLTSPPAYTPFEALSAFNGQNVSGTWTLHVSDNGSGDTGTLVSWALIADRPGANPCPSGPTCTASSCSPGSIALVDGAGHFSGWCVTTSTPNASIFVDSVNMTTKTVAIEITKTFSSPPNSAGLISPILIDFVQVCDDANTATHIVISDESITNNTGVAWTDYHWDLFTGPESWFDVAASAGWDVSPFTSKVFGGFIDSPINNKAKNLDVKGGGTVSSPGGFFPGFGPGVLHIGVNLGASTPVSFVLKQRPTIDNQTPIEGACCQASGGCTVVTASECAAQGGTYQGNNVSCSPNPCPVPQGACCHADGSCSQNTAADCLASGGVYQGDNASCSPNPCPQPTGACCDAATGGCQIVTAADCSSAGGTYQGNGSSCTPNPCPQPTGACCFTTGECQSLTGKDCITAGGTYQGNGSSCTPNPCPQPSGACCSVDGTCSITTQAACTGIWQGAFTSCTPNPCPQPSGACCVCATPNCLLVTADQCSAAGGTYQGNGSTCVGNTCPRPLDDCACPGTIECGASVTFSNVGFTTVASDPVYPCHFSAPAQGVGTAWFKFVATNTTADIDTCGSLVSDTLLAVYSGTCGNFTQLGCSEDAGTTAAAGCPTSTGLRARLCVSGLSVGTTYYIQVASFDAASQGTITLHVSCPCASGSCCLNGNCQVTTLSGCPAPGVWTLNGVCTPNPCPQPVTNDTCANATALGGSYPISITGSSCGATDDNTGTCGTSGLVQGVWLKVIGNGTTLTATTCNAFTNFDTKLQVFCGNCPSGLVCVTGNDDATAPTTGCTGLPAPFDPLLVRKSRVTWCSAAGQTYFILVGSFNNTDGKPNCGNYQVDITSGASCTTTLNCVPPVPPVNDNCASATAISGPGTFPFDNINATTDGPAHTGAPCNFTSNTQINKDVWYCWTATCTDTVKIAVCLTPSFDSRLAVYNGCTCPVTAANLVPGTGSCNDDTTGCGPSAFGSTVTFAATAGNQYLIRLGVFSSSTAGRAASFVITCGAVTASPTSPTFGDIKPDFYPNLIRAESNGVVPVAITSTADFDAALIDLTTVKMTAADRDEIGIAPYVSTGPTSGMTEIGASPARIINFRTSNVFQQFKLDGASSGTILEVLVTGQTVDGKSFKVADTLKVNAIDPAATVITVTSGATDAWISSNVADAENDNGGFANFVQRFRNHEGSVTYTAPQTVGTATFSRWKVDGAQQAAGTRSITVGLSSSHALEAVYITPGTSVPVGPTTPGPTGPTAPRPRPSAIPQGSVLQHGQQEIPG